MTHQGCNETEVMNVRLTRISAEARSLLDKILLDCPTDIRNNTTATRFLCWLHGSGLIRTAFTVEQLQQADQQWRDRMSSLGIKRQDAIYGCAYWLVR
jgi:hypothetical protein